GATGDRGRAQGDRRTRLRHAARVGPRPFPDARPGQSARGIQPERADLQPAAGAQPEERRAIAGRAPAARRELRLEALRLGVPRLGPRIRWWRSQKEPEWNARVCALRPDRGPTGA